MRTVVLVFVVVAMLLVQSVLIGLLPAYAPPPAVGMLVALHVALSPRWSLSAGVVAAFATGYLFDLIAGAPGGTHALVYSLVALGIGLLSSRLLLRGYVLRAAACFVVTLMGALVIVALRAWVTPGAGWGGLRYAPLEASFTALAGPLLLRLLERVDGRLEAKNRTAGGLTLS